MNSIITLNRLSELVARAAGVKMSEAESFLKAFMDTAKLAISQDGHLAIKGIGVFKAIDEGGERKVAFQPDAELAGNVNSPFAMFTPEELAPGESIESLDIDIAIDDPEFIAGDQASAQADDEATPSTHQPEAPYQDEKTGEASQSETLAEEQQPEPIGPTEIPADAQQSIPTNFAEVEESETEPKTNLAAAYSSPRSFPAETDSEYEEEYEEGYCDEEYEEGANKKFPLFWTTWALIIGLLIGLAIGFFAHDPICELLEPTVIEQEDEEYAEEESTEAEPADVVDTTVMAEEADEPQQATVATVKPTAETEADVYDTITERTFLTHLAQKHYHQKDYWVYIYLENQDAIGNPNTVKAGTRVKIPPLSKYAKHSSEAENLKEAKALAAKILKKG